MIISQIEGNLDDLPAAELEAASVEYVTFDNESRLKRVQRLKTDSGEEIALRLGNDFRELHSGDILVKDGEKLIVARIEPSDVLVIKPTTIRQALSVAHTLGNRHLQAQFFGADSEYVAEVMVVRYDHTVEHTLDHLGVPYERGEHVMPEAFRHAEHSH